MHTKLYKKLGFSLIELMIVITIVGIISFVAIPAYIDYVTKAKVSNAISILEGLKKTALQNYTENNVFPTLPLPSSPTSYPYTDDTISASKIASIAAGSSNYPGGTGSARIAIAATDSVIGYVQITFSANMPTDLQNKVLNLVAIENNILIRWQCITGNEADDSNSKIDLRLLPLNCR